MKKIYLLILLLCGCQSITVPQTFAYKEIQTDSYRLVSWQKITDEKSPVRIYIEGDGHAFNHIGQPTDDPTPRGTFLREIAFSDPNPNVIYLARPCQYVSDSHCRRQDWTTGRFSQGIIDSTAQAIRTIRADQPVVLIGYSGGALLSGLVIAQNPKMPVLKWITIAGVLNHTRWTQDLHLPPLSDSVDLEKLPQVNQLHLVGDKDNIISYKMTQDLVAPENFLLVPNATHASGFDDFLSKIYKDL